MPRVHPFLSTLILASALLPSGALAQGRGPFDDVPNSHWAHEAVQDLAKRGYFTGYQDGQFKGRRPVTRQEVGVVFDRFLRDLGDLIATRTASVAGPRGEQGSAGPQGPRGPQGPAGLQGHPGMVPHRFQELTGNRDDLATRLSASKDLSQALLERMRAIRARLREVDAELAGLNDRTRRIKPAPIH